MKRQTAMWVRKAEEGGGEMPVTLETGNALLIHAEWLLTPQRIAVHLPTATAVLADLHLGYNEARRRDGEAVPPADLAFILAPLRSVLSVHSIRRIVIAGDLFEAGPVTDLAAQLRAWMTDAGVELAAVVPGNHDRGLANDAHGLPINPDGCTIGRWRILHGDGPAPDGPVVHGHEHPCVRWSARAAGPCYLVGEDRLVLPAFSQDAAGVNILNARKWLKFRCCDIAGDRVLEFGELEALQKRLGRAPSPPPLAPRGERGGGEGARPARRAEGTTVTSSAGATSCFSSPSC